MPSASSWESRPLLLTARPSPSSSLAPVYRTVHVAVEGRAAVVTKLDRPATATLHLPSTVFVRLAGGRADVMSGLDTICLAGDLDLARRVAENLAFTI